MLLKSAAQVFARIPNGLLEARRGNNVCKRLHDYVLRRIKKAGSDSLLFFCPPVGKKMAVCRGAGSGRHVGCPVQDVREVFEEVDAHLPA